MRSFRTWFAALLVLAAGAGVPARAEPPSNDRPDGAMTAQPLPFSHLADYSEATSSEDEPIECWNPLALLPARVPGQHGGQTLWYRYDATEPTGLIAWGHRTVNENGYLDLGVYRATESGLELVGCVSSSPSSPWTDEVVIRADAGESFMFMMSMTTYPSDTTATFSLISTEPTDLTVLSLDAAPISHDTDAGTVSTGEEYDFTFEIGADPASPGWVGWTLDVCAKPLVPGTGRCSRSSGGVAMWSSARTVRTRVTGIGVGDFVATVRVMPARRIDPDPADNERSIELSVLKPLGFGIG